MIFQSFWDDLNVKYNINYHNVISIINHAVIVGISVALTIIVDAIGQYVTHHDFGQYSILILMVWTIILKFYKEWASGIDPTNAERITTYDPVSTKKGRR